MSKKYFTICIIQKGKYDDCKGLPSKYIIKGNIFSFIF